MVDFPFFTLIIIKNIPETDLMYFLAVYKISSFAYNFGHMY